MGIARLLEEQQPDNMNNPSAHTESVSKNNNPKGQKAKQIFLGIDAHPARNQVARKTDNGAFKRCKALASKSCCSLLKTVTVGRRSLRGLRSWAIGLGALPPFAGARD
jgi:hypothetical protein